MSIFTKVFSAVEAGLDSYIAKAQVAPNAPGPSESKNPEHLDNDRKGYMEMDVPMNDQGLFREKMSGIPNSALKNMARRDSIIIAIHQCLINQVANFTQPQVDKYSPGFKIRARKPADISRGEKLSLSDPSLDEATYKQLAFDLETKRTELHDQQETEIEKLTTFIAHCGSDKAETNTTYKRMDFDKFVKLVVADILTYNYLAAETIPTKDGKAIASFHPLSAGTIRYVSSRSAGQAGVDKNLIRTQLGASHVSESTSETKPYRYAQVLRGKPVAAWTEDDFIFEAKNPTIDPEDYGYAQGVLEWLVNTVTNHLYAETHNKNFFTNGTTKGLLHIKGDNINRAQLDAFQRKWYASLTGPQNSFRPPVIGMADEVRWVPLTQSNREMEFQEWMQYLIKICCGCYQIDPAEINFDITKSNSGTLNEANNAERIKSSKNKGLRPLLMFLQNVVNNQILPKFDKALAEKYIFEFVGLDAETKTQEIDRFTKEIKVYRTPNEVRNEQGLAPLEYGDIILDGAYTQYVQMQEAALAAQQMPGMDPNAPPADNSGMGSGENGELQDEDVQQDDSDIADDMNSLMDVLNAPDEKPKADDKPDVKKAVTVEYHHYLKDDK